MVFASTTAFTGIVSASQLAVFGRLGRGGAASKLLGNLNAIHLLFDKPLESCKFLHFASVIAVDQSEALTIAVSSCRTANTMHIILRIVWHIEVDNQFYARNIDAARHDVGRHDNVGSS